MRLIDADDAPLFLNTVACEQIKQMPTVDAVPVIRCEGCEQRKYGCSTFIDHHQIYGFCAWGWKAERKEE